MTVLMSVESCHYVSHHLQVQVYGAESTEFEIMSDVAGGLMRNLFPSVPVEALKAAISQPAS